MIPQLAKPTSTLPTQAGSFHWAEAHPGTLYARVCRTWDGTSRVTTVYDFVDPRFATDIAFAANVKMQRQLVVVPGAPPEQARTGSGLIVVAR